MDQQSAAEWIIGRAPPKRAGRRSLLRGGARAAILLLSAVVNERWPEH